MSTLIILFSVMLLLTFVALWSFLAMASWSDRKITIAWQEWAELNLDAGRDGTEIPSA